ncbi:MAG: arylsulfatase, partial [Planctomycetota bacterium]
MRLALHFCVLFVLLGSAAVMAEDSQMQKPNVIFILADDLGYGDLGCFGQTNFATPRLDRMAAEGMKLTQHYAGSTVCAPSRACLLTGMHTGHVYNRANGDRNAFRNDPDDICIATLLKQAGYTTAMIGKSGLACGSKDLKLPNNKGFDHFFGYLTHKGAHRYYPKQLYRNGEVVKYPENQGREGQTYSGDLFTEDALKFLEANKDQPFFLHLSLQQPHADLQVPTDWREKFLGKYEEKPHKGGFYRPEANPKATFAGMVTYLDDAVGQVFDKLNSLGIDENTLVIFSSDNGAMSEGGWSRHNFDSSGKLRGGKRDLYEGGIRVPTIVRWPGKVAAGSSSDHISAFWDFVPTVCELVGINPPLATDGISYLPTILGQGEQAQHDYLYWEFHEQGGKQAVRKGKWKAVRKTVNKNRNSPIELFDLEADLHEDKNIAATNPKIVAEMKALMRDAHDGMGIVDFAKPESVGVRKLLRGKDLSDWKKTNFGGEGEVSLEKGILN